MRKSILNSVVALMLVLFLIMPNMVTSAVEIKSLLETDVKEVIQIEANNELGNELDGDIKPTDGVENNTEEYIKPEEGIGLKDELGNKAEDSIGIEEKEDLEVKVDMDVENDGLEPNIKSISTEKYEIVKRPQLYSKNIGNPDDYYREEVIGRREAISELEYLVPKTDSNYEVAIAYSDGSYSYVESVETIEDGINKVKQLPLPQSEEEVIPVIINNEGQVVYSTNSMLRVISSSGNVINMYPTSSLTGAFTYISQDYVDDAPVIEDNGYAVRVEVSGYTGWIDKSTASEVVPINQVKNPSYYVSEGGVLKHYISYNLKASDKNGYTLTLGPAPSYLREGVRYFSYDGNYFYDGGNISTGLNNVITDLKNGNHNNSVNANNPHYLYFNYLPFRSRTSYTATELNKFIKDNTSSISKLRGIGEYLIEAQNTYGVNAILTLAVAINESGWGESPISQAKNNLFGLAAYDSNPGESADVFATPGNSVLEFAKNYISRGYADPADWRYYGGFIGNKSKGANVKYASDPFWGEKAAQYAYKIDSYLSGRDQDAYQLAMYKADNQVKTASGQLLYNITNNHSVYGGYHNTPLILTSLSKIQSNGATLYEMYPERNTSVNDGGTSNKFSGYYDWSSRGYVNTNGITLINSSKNAALPHDPTYKGAWKMTADGNWYYYDGVGNLYKGWLNINGTYYYLDRVTGQMKTGWFKENGKKYYLKSTGEMAVGWHKIEGKWYFLNSNGEMHTSWLDYGGTWYYLNSDGTMATGWKAYNGYWYFLNENSGEMKIGWQYITGEWYLFSAYGLMQEGWVHIGLDSYYLHPSSGIMARNETVNGVYFKSDGRALK